MALNLAKVVIGYLKDRPEEKFSARQIAEWVFATYPDECQEKRANSRGDYIKSDADLVQQLVAENPADSQVLIPARERDEIDWDMANRLATENRDFLEYVKLVKQFYQTGEARPADWDVPDLDY